MKANNLDRTTRIVDAVTMLAEAWRQKATEATFLAFESGLSGVPIDVIEQAANQAIRSCKFMPSVYEFLQLCGQGAGSVGAEERALIAWTVVRKSVSAVGGYQTVVFDDPIATATVRALGGWNRVCETPAGKDLDTWLRNDFVALYVANLAAGISAEAARPLPGLDAATRNANGYDLPEPKTIVVGLPKIGKNLIRGVIQEPKKLVALPEAKQFVESLGLPELVGQSEEIPITPEERSEDLERKQQEKREAARELEVSAARVRGGQVELMPSINDPTAKPFRSKGNNGEKTSGGDGSRAGKRTGRNPDGDS